MRDSDIKQLLSGMLKPRKSFSECLSQKDPRLRYSASSDLCSIELRLMSELSNPRNSISLPSDPVVNVFKGHVCDWDKTILESNFSHSEVFSMPDIARALFMISDGVQSRNLGTSTHLEATDCQEESSSSLDKHHQCNFNVPEADSDNEYSGKGCSQNSLSSPP